NLPMPKKLLDAGILDMVRVSDARMSGTGYGTCVLHVSPEAAAGGPLALIRTGDVVELDAAGHRLDLLVEPGELEARRAAWRAPAPPAERGWVRLYVEHVQGAERGADLDFLVGGSGDDVPRHSH
ncbi:dihydroxy-acid dehydratase, partial [Acidimicrobiaceae bacterium USS-CC1]|nr:dihydroxy-acid dehydratase [Acidiferrimicrobium australe]